MKKGILFLLVTISCSSLVFAQANMTLQVGMQFPSGDFSQVAHNGLGGTAEIDFPQDQFLSLSASISYNYWGPYTAWYLGPSDSYTSLQVLAGLSYSLSLNKTHPYLGLSVGMNSLDFSRTTSYGTTSTIYEASETRFCISPVAGIIVNINSTLDFNINLKYNASTSGKINGITLPATFFGLNAGLQFKLY